MNPSELGLRDIHLPGDITWWPPAFGSWLFGAALVSLITDSYTHLTLPTIYSVYF